MEYWIILVPMKCCLSCYFHKFFRFKKKSAYSKFLAFLVFGLWGPSSFINVFAGNNMHFFRGIIFGFVQINVNNLCKFSLIFVNFELVYSALASYVQQDLC